MSHSVWEKKCLSSESHFLLWWYSASLPEGAVRPVRYYQRALKLLLSGWSYTFLRFYSLS